jgi:hypothetical protein
MCAVQVGGIPVKKRPKYFREVLLGGMPLFMSLLVVEFRERIDKAIAPAALSPQV